MTPEEKHLSTPLISIVTGPEITDRRFLEEQRRIAHKQRVAEEMYYATEGTAKSYYGTEMPRREDDNGVR